MCGCVSVCKDLFLTTAMNPKKHQKRKEQLVLKEMQCKVVQGGKNAVLEVSSSHLKK